MKQSQKRMLGSAARETTKFQNYESLRISDDVKEKLNFFRENLSAVEREYEKVRLENEKIKSEQLKLSESVDSEADNEFLVKLLMKVLECGRLSKHHFMFKMIQTQLTCCQTESVRAFRWDPAIIHFAMSIQFLGGQSLLDFLRGRSTEGQGKSGALNNKVEDWELYLPANSTLRAFLPYVDVYAGISDEVIDAARETIFQSGSKDKNGEITAGWIGDEIEIRKGIVYNRFSGSLIGKVSGPVAENKAKDLDWDVNQVRPQLASHVMQIFVANTNGTAFIPLGFLPTISMKGQQIYDLVHRLKKKFSEGKNPVSIIWGSTDGFSNNHEFLKLLEKDQDKNSKYCHFFDYVHIMKNIRNTILNKVVKTPECPLGFHMNDLISWKEKSTIARDLLPLELVPKDKMNVDNITQLIQPKFLAELKKSMDPSLQGLHTYFSFLRTFYNIFDDNNMPFEKKLADIDAVLTYFLAIKNNPVVQASNKPGNNLLSQIETTLKSLKLLSAYVGPENVLTSALGTNVVENFFSLVRRKVRYPSLWDYACFYARAKLEHVKKFSDDSLYHYRKYRIGKKYNNSNAVHYTMTSIKLLSSRDREEMKKKKSGKYGRTTPRRHYTLQFYCRNFASFHKIFDHSRSHMQI
eukprot:Pompholyxophrys_punicea_v1_NODE_265_length_2478_cov_92.556748.p1 type:complete len:635 gc:universal NODE_265_length_2478_cov_92.556748:567-2471(+)